MSAGMKNWYFIKEKTLYTPKNKITLSERGKALTGAEAPGENASVSQAVGGPS